MRPETSEPMTIEELRIATLDMIASLDAANFPDPNLDTATYSGNSGRNSGRPGLSKGLRYHPHATRPRRFKCRHCNNSFGEEQVLKEHEEIHKGGGLECVRCGLKKTTIKDMVIHIQKHVMETHLIEDAIEV